MKVSGQGTGTPPDRLPTKIISFQNVGIPSPDNVFLLLTLWNRQSHAGSQLSGTVLFRYIMSAGYKGQTLKKISRFSEFPRKCYSLPFV